MSDVVIGVIVRPLTAIVLLLSAAFAAQGILRLIPEGRIKRFLMKRF